MNKSTKRTIKVFVADDHPLLRQGFIDAMEDLLDQIDVDFKIKVIGSADNPRDAVEAYKKKKPDVVVMDILFKEKMTGLDAVREIIKFDSEAKIVVLSMHDQGRMIKEAYKIGALAFITKGADPEYLIEAIQSAASGEKYMLPEVMEKLAFYSVEDDKDPREALSEMEFQIYELIANDYSNSEIVEETKMSLKSVNNALMRIREKLGLRKNTEIMKHAIKHRVIFLDED